MNLYLGLYDYIVFAFVLIANIFIWKKKISNKAGCILGLLIFGFTLPLISVGVEINSYQKFTIDKPFDDSFEMLYVYNRFPIYWMLGILQTGVFVIKNKLNKKLDKSDVRR